MYLKPLCRQTSLTSAGARIFYSLTVAQSVRSASYLLPTRWFITCRLADNIPAAIEMTSSHLEKTVPAARHKPPALCQATYLDAEMVFAEGRHSELHGRVRQIILRL